MTAIFRGIDSSRAIAKASILDLSFAAYNPRGDKGIPPVAFKGCQTAPPVISLSFGAAARFADDSGRHQPLLNGVYP